MADEHPYSLASEKGDGIDVAGADAIDRTERGEARTSRWDVVGDSPQGATPTTPRSRSSAISRSE